MRLKDQKTGEYGSVHRFDFLLVEPYDLLLIETLYRAAENRRGMTRLIRDALLAYIQGGNKQAPSIPILPARKTEPVPQNQDEVVSALVSSFGWSDQ